MQNKLKHFLRNQGYSFRYNWKKCNHYTNWVECTEEAFGRATIGILNSFRRVYGRDNSTIFYVVQAEELYFPWSIFIMERDMSIVLEWWAFHIQASRLGSKQISLVLYILDGVWRECSDNKSQNVTLSRWGKCVMRMPTNISIVSDGIIPLFRTTVHHHWSSQ